ncbi:MAG: protein kinase [Kiritimatiellaeota bacterium]|nr:protein kinase [Kiritimatiellota bacterium]
MSEGSTMRIDDGHTVKISSVSQAPTTANLSTSFETTIVTEKMLTFSPDELKTLLPLDSQYTISKKIAEGGQGIIQVARDNFLKRSVAVKSLKTELLENDQVVENFVTEAKITSQLEHPAIIPLHSINSSDGGDGLHIAMKMIRGKNLREILDDTVLKCKERRRTGNLRAMTHEFLKERLEDLVKVCDAVAFAHSKGVYHRDIKPSNIMIGEFHEVYVMDWGIASLSEDESGKGGGGEDEKPQIDGTPGFIAPEVVVGGRHTASSDQYALGIILFEMATMAPAITGDNVKEIFEKTRDARLEPLIHRFPRCGISNDLKAIIRKATATNPDNRYAYVSDFATDIRRFLAGDELDARPDNPPRKISRWMSKHRGLAATMTLSFLLLCAGIAIFALVKRNQVIRETKKRSLALSSLQALVESRAHVIDKHYFHIVHFLDRFVWEAKGCLLEEPKTNRPPLFIDYKRFSADAGDASVSLETSKVYGLPISLSFGSVKAPPSLPSSEKATKYYSEILSPLVPLMFRLLVYSDPSDFPKNDTEARKHALSVGYPIAWIYLGLPNGLMFNFPGHSELPNSYDPRKRKWYKDALTSDKLVWSNPYKDAFGRGLVVSASKSVRGTKGEILGVAGIDTTFDYILTVLMNPGKQSASWSVARYILDSEGKVLISSSLKDAEKKDDSSSLEFPPFPYIKIYSLLERGNSGQFEIEEDGVQRLVVYAPVQTMGWHFVEIVDLSGYLADRAKKQTSEKAGKAKKNTQQRK